MYRYKILIVDDDTLLQNSLNYIMADKYDTLIAGSGEKAIRILENHSIDLVLLDIRLPGMDGVETLEKIKKMNQEVTLWEGTKFILTATYQSRNMVGEKYRLHNISKETLRITEQELFRKGVMAVAIENLVLDPGQSTNVYVIRGGL